MIQPERGFHVDELKRRTQRAQAKMRDAGLSALLLTTEPEVRYYSGFLTRFWESPTRPWFLVLPPTGEPIAVIPAIGARLMATTWVSDIRTWNAPNYVDDGIGLLANTLCEVTPEDGKIGLAHAIESHLRMPLVGYQQLDRSLGKRCVVDDRGITRDLRLVKSEVEIDKIRFAASVASRAFDRVPEIARVGVPLSVVFRKFQSLCLDEGADWVPYLAGAAAPGGYADVISPSTDRPMARGDVLMIDTGAVWDGYFCDFDRNYAIGAVSLPAAEAHSQLIDATHAAFEAAQPGKTMADLFRVMNAVLGHEGEVGRLGHGLGMQLTEWPSIIPDDPTPLVPGMVLTLEPFVAMKDDKIMVHEENIVIRDHGAEYLSAPAAKTLEVLC